MILLWSILQVLPAACTGFYLRANERYRRFVAVKNERLELVTEHEAERDHLRTKFFVQDDKIVSSLGVACGQTESLGAKAIYMCRYASYDSYWLPHPVDSGNTVQIKNKSETKCWGYSTIIGLKHNYIKQVDCNSPNETHFTMVYETRHHPAQHHVGDEKRFEQRHNHRYT